MDLLEQSLPKLLYTKEQAAAILFVSVSTIEGLLRKDSTPRHVLAGKLRFTMDDLEQIVKSSVKD